MGASGGGLRTAVRVVMEPALRLIQGDPHEWSERPLPAAPSRRSWASRAAPRLTAPLELLYRRALFSPKIRRCSPPVEFFDASTGSGSLTRCVENDRL